MYYTAAVNRTNAGVGRQRREVSPESGREVGGRSLPDIADLDCLFRPSGAAVVFTLMQNSDLSGDIAERRSPHAHPEYSTLAAGVLLKVKPSLTALMSATKD